MRASHRVGTAALLVLGMVVAGGCSGLPGSAADADSHTTVVTSDASSSRPPVSATGAGSPATAQPSSSPGPVPTTRTVTEGTTLIRVTPPPSRAGGDRVVPYTVEIEQGLKVDRTAVAARIGQILEDPKGWQRRDNVNFVPVPIGSRVKPRIRVTVVTPRVADRLCAPLRTKGKLSCWNGSRRRAVLNSNRWLRGADTYGSDLARYRIYLVNHEVGHGLGHAHQYCPRRGAPAPIMVQQTKSLQGCRSNPYP